MAGLDVETGRAVLRAFQNLRLLPPDESTLALDATRRAGAAIDLALRIRRHGRLSIGEVQSFARFAALSPFDLKTWCLPALRAADLLDYSVDSEGQVAVVEEQVGVTAPVLEEAARVWLNFDPDPLERCAIDSADLAAHAPLTISDHRTQLEDQGHDASLHERAFLVLQAIRLLRSERSPRLEEQVLFSPYVWGNEALDVAAFLHALPDAERNQLTALAHQTQARPGVPFEHLGGDSALLRGARKVGLLDGTRVVTTGAERGFAFPPGLERRVGGGQTDTTHERKLFVAHILNGHYFGHPATGRINDPIALVSAMIHRGTVGPTTAARTDYLLLETAGIVRARPFGHRAYLELVKDDVARDSLDLIEQALQGEGASAGANSVDALWLPGSYTTPEQDRRQLPEATGAQQEILATALDDLREETQRRLRDEELST